MPFLPEFRKPGYEKWVPLPNNPLIILKPLKTHPTPMNTINKYCLFANVKRKPKD
jgi:hypothetical protein